MAFKTFQDWPDDLFITQYLQVGDRVDNAMYEYFLNETPPRYHTGNLHTGDVLQAGSPCDVAPNKDDILQPTYLTFVKDAENDCWIFKGECCPGELINRNPELKPVVDKTTDNIKSYNLYERKNLTPQELREGYRAITGLDNDGDFTDDEIYSYMLEAMAENNVDKLIDNAKSRVEDVRSANKEKERDNVKE